MLYSLPRFIPIENSIASSVSITMLCASLRALLSLSLMLVSSSHMACVAMLHFSCCILSHFGIATTVCPHIHDLGFSRSGIPHTVHLWTFSDMHWHALRQELLQIMYLADSWLVCRGCTSSTFPIYVSACSEWQFQLPHIFAITCIVRHFNFSNLADW